jgi:hypothetical protein
MIKSATYTAFHQRLATNRKSRGMYDDFGSDCDDTEAMTIQDWTNVNHLMRHARQCVDSTVKRAKENLSMPYTKTASVCCVMTNFAP